ncbi:hypothetical protein M011DRAFT_221520 [Sporormia fimetaria CBS 119925]|uniref:Uncharacterized protein n=1 Tax=Sporormia fimetaria CBS 119925 TaxID=1340428 RepID=A0A6A6V2A2_9PLEO|nr:hypothetical protein M011DRAFT_221520 [Sporormia fimetaria CBS 119925]
MFGSQFFFHSFFKSISSAVFAPLMDAVPTSPRSKRFAMHFRQRTPTVNIVNQFASPDRPSSSGKVSAGTDGTRPSVIYTLDMSPSLSRIRPRGPRQETNASFATRAPIPRSQSSDHYSYLYGSPATGQGPRSMKTSEATIVTNATTTQPAFESDAFAVHMPSTREPILGPRAPRAPRGEPSSPTKAQTDAYQTYKRKAQEVRERNHQEGVRIPSQIKSYDYAYAHAEPPRNARMPDNSPDQQPAGSFPASPPILQQGWAPPVRSPKGPRSVSEGSYIIGRKPVGHSNASNSSKMRAQKHDRVDTQRGASVTTSPSRSKPSPIKIRIRAKSRAAEPVQKESFWTLYNRSPQPASAETSRSTSPSKPGLVSTDIRPNEHVFGHTTADITGTPARTASHAGKPAKLPTKGASRWAWLRSTIALKPSPTLPKTPPPLNTPNTLKSYIDPFLSIATPTASAPSTPHTSRPSSPRKLVPRHKPQPSISSDNPAGKFETGYQQIKSLTSLVLKICLVVYVLIALYFVLDAIRETARAMGAPLRWARWVWGWLWIVGKWIWEALVRVWVRWGVKVRWKGGRWW